MPPFWKANPAVWPVVVETIPAGTVWPDALIVEDIRWWADQIRVGRAAGLPGRRKLAERWGVTTHKVRAMLREVDPFAHSSPTRRPLVAHSSPTFEAKAEVEPLLVAHSSPTSRPLVAHSSPHARVTTEHTEQQNKDVPVKPSPVEAVWSAYVKHHPRARLTEQRRKVIRLALRELKGMSSPVESLALLIEWYHKAPEAAFWRGENDRRKAYLGIRTLLAVKDGKLADRLEQAEAWQEAQSHRRPQRSREAAEREYLNKRRKAMGLPPVEGE